MLNRVYVMVRCLSVCASVSLSVPSFSCCTLPQRVCCCGPSRQETSIDCCMASAVHSGNCEQCHTFSWRTKLNADLFYITASLWLPTSVCLVQSFTARTATSAFGLGRRHWSSPHQCCLNCPRTLFVPHGIKQTKITKRCSHISQQFCSSNIEPSVLWRCWLGGRKGIRLVKNWVVRCWRGYLAGASCRLAYGPADVTATHCLLLQ